MPLIADIMDGEERAGPGPRRVVPIERLEIGHSQRRLPIMGVQDVRRPSRLFAGLHDRPAKQGEPIEVVGIIAAALSIESLPGKEGIISDTGERDRAAAERPGLDADLKAFAAPGNLNTGRLPE